MFLEGRNNGFAKSLRIQPSAASRDKPKLLKLACQIVGLQEAVWLINSVSRNIQYSINTCSLGSALTTQEF